MAAVKPGSGGTPPTSAPTGGSLPPVLNWPICDPDTGIATPAFAQFLARLWGSMFGTGGLTTQISSVTNNVTNLITQVNNTIQNITQITETDDVNSAILEQLSDQMADLVTDTRVLQVLLATGFEALGRASGFQAPDPDQLRDELTKPRDPTTG